MRFIEVFDRDFVAHECRTKKGSVVMDDDVAGRAVVVVVVDDDAVDARFFVYIHIT